PHLVEDDAGSGFRRLERSLAAGKTRPDDVYDVQILIVRARSTKDADAPPTAEESAAHWRARLIPRPFCAGSQYDSPYSPKIARNVSEISPTVTNTRQHSRMWGIRLSVPRAARSSCVLAQRASL